MLNYVTRSHYNTSSNAGFEEDMVLITLWTNRSEYPIDSSIARYCSQPFEFSETSFMTNRSLCLPLMFTFLPYNLVVIDNIR